MLIHQNLISDEEIQILRDYWKKNQDDVYINGYLRDEIQDYRLDINDRDPEFDIIKKIVRTDFADYLRPNGDAKDGVFFWSALQQAVIPHVLHIDDCFVDSRPAYTYIISFDTYDKHKTLAWKRICQDGNRELHSLYEDWVKNYSSMPILSNSSELYDIDHTANKDGKYMLDYFELDGGYSYVKGNGCVFNARQMHCTSNWKKYNEFEYRELLQIHVTIPDLIEL